MKNLNYILFVMTMVVFLFGISQLYHFEVTPLTSNAQTSNKYDFQPCYAGIGDNRGLCDRVDRIIEQNDQLIKLDAYNFCINYYAMGQVTARGYGGFDNCVQKVQDETK